MKLTKQDINSRFNQAHIKLQTKVRNQVWVQVRDHVRDQVLHQVRMHVWDLLRNNIWN